VDCILVRQSGQRVIHSIFRNQEIEIVATAERGIAKQPGREEWTLEGNGRHIGTRQSAQDGRQLDQGPSAALARRPDLHAQPNHRPECGVRFEKAEDPMPRG
jgi:hypothetical protein